MLCRSSALSWAISTCLSRYLDLNSYRPFWLEKTGRSRQSGLLRSAAEEAINIGQLHIDRQDTLVLKWTFSLPVGMELTVFSAMIRDSLLDSGMTPG